MSKIQIKQTIKHKNNNKKTEKKHIRIIIKKRVNT